MDRPRVNDEVVGVREDELSAGGLGVVERNVFQDAIRRHGHKTYQNRFDIRFFIK